jgi:hypothetical protein
VLQDSRGQRRFPLELLMDLHELRGDRRPCTYYELLGIAEDERAPGVIEEAAIRLAGQARAYQLTHEPECTRLLGAIARSVITLLDPIRRAEYDRSLGTPPAPLAPAHEGVPDTPATDGASAPRPCDVQLVYSPNLDRRTVQRNRRGPLRNQVPGEISCFSF